MKGATIEQLYQRRLKIMRQLYLLNEQIGALENTDQWTAVMRVHHQNGCGRPRYKELLKVTNDWDLVDCIPCHTMRERRAKVPPRTTRPQKGKDWKEIIS